MNQLCFACHTLGPIAYVDPVDRGYCAECTLTLPIGSVARAMQFQTLTVPFKVGDRVGAYTAEELYDGVGTVTAIEFDHLVSPVVPTYVVRIDDPADAEIPHEGSYSEASLVRAGVGG